jgi:hypothetical protein
MQQLAGSDSPAYAIKIIPGCNPKTQGKALNVKFAVYATFRCSQIFVSTPDGWYFGAVPPIAKGLGLKAEIKSIGLAVCDNRIRKY